MTMTRRQKAAAVVLAAAAACAVGCDNVEDSTENHAVPNSSSTRAAPSTEVMCASFDAFVDDGMPVSRRAWIVHTLRVRADGQTEAGVAAATIDLRRALKKSERAWQHAAEDFGSVCSRVGWKG